MSQVAVFDRASFISFLSPRRYTAYKRRYHLTYLPAYLPNLHHVCTMDDNPGPLLCLLRRDGWAEKPNPGQDLALNFKILGSLVF